MTYEGTAELRLRSKYLGFLQIFRFFAFLDLLSRFIALFNIYTLLPRICLSMSIYPPLLSTSSPFSIVTRSPRSVLSVFYRFHSRILSAIIYSLTSHSTYWHYYYYYYDYTGTTIIIIGTTLLAPRLTLRRLLSRYRLDCPHLRLRPVLYRHRRTIVTSPSSSPSLSSFYFNTVVCLKSISCSYPESSRRSSTLRRGPTVMNVGLWSLGL